MPGFTTHYILGMKAYNDLPNNQLKYIIAKYRWLYQLALFKEVYDFQIMCLYVSFITILA